MKNCLESFDIFGQPISILYKENSFIKTKIGGFFSILSCLLVIVTCWIYGNDMIYRKNPISYTNDAVSESYPRNNLTRASFPLAFNFADDVSNPVNDFSILNMTLTLKTIEITDNETIETYLPLDLVPCTLEHFPQISKITFDNSLLQTYLCAASDNIFVEGYWNSNKITYLTLEAFMCDYDNPKKKCMSKKFIEDFVSEKLININVMSINHIVTLSNPDNPISKFVSLSYKFIDTNIKKITNFFIEPHKPFSDFIFIFPNYEETNFNYLKELQTDFMKENENDKKIFELNFYSSNISKYYYRKYIKIFDIISYLGGITKFLTIIFSYLNKNFCNLELLTFFIDNFPNFSDKKQEENSGHYYNKNSQQININKSKLAINLESEIKTNKKSLDLDDKCFQSNNNIDISNIPIIRNYSKFHGSYQHLKMENNNYNNKNNVSFSSTFKVSYWKYYYGKLNYILQTITNTSCKRNSCYKTYEQTTLLLKKMNKNLDIKNFRTSIFLNNSRSSDSDKNNKDNIKQNKFVKQDTIFHKESKESNNKIIMNPKINAFRNIKGQE